MSWLKDILRSVVMTFVAATLGLPVTLAALGAMVFFRWRIVPFAAIFVNLARSAIWYWLMLVGPAASGVALALPPAGAAVAGAILAVPATVPCVAAMTGSTVAGVISAFAARRVDSAIIALAAALGGAVAGSLGSVLRRKNHGQE